MGHQNVAPGTSSLRPVVDSGIKSRAQDWYKFSYRTVSTAPKWPEQSSECSVMSTMHHFL